jgi:hypothetical protein
VTITHSSLFPTRLSFPGLPHGRWWQFEDARYNWAALDADRRELAKTLVLDFILVQGDDWFTVPLCRPVGSAQRIDQLPVRDVFDEWTMADRADTGDDRWTMFSVADVGGGRADYSLLPPSVLRATVDGPVLDEVQFLRDEEANMVWAVEATTENGVGRAWDGRERALTVTDAPPPDPPTEAPLRYRLPTRVPVNRIPFLPVRTGTTGRKVALRRAAVQRFRDGALERPARRPSVHTGPSGGPRGPPGPRGGGRALRHAHSALGAAGPLAGRPDLCMGVETPPGRIRRGRRRAGVRPRRGDAAPAQLTDRDSAAAQAQEQQ